VEHSKRESPLDTGNLILIQFHRVDSAAPVLVILGVRPEDTREQNTGAASERMDWLIFFRHDDLLFKAAFKTAREENKGYCVE
jgi:hypothetical protein